MIINTKTGRVVWGFILSLILIFGGIGYIEQGGVIWIGSAVAIGGLCLLSLVAFIMSNTRPKGYC